MKLRIKFKKDGVMRFVGHLDIMRYFQKAIRRADIDIAYSGGFNPHQIMSFAAPLGVGLTSGGEYMDILVNNGTNSNDMKRKLNEVMSSGMEILSVRMLPENAGNAMASVAAAEYSVKFRSGYEPDFDWISQIKVLMNCPEIPFLKKTKKSEIELDLKKFIYSLELTPENTVHMMVDASSAGNIKPSFIMEAFLKANDRNLNEFALEIKREDTYTNTGTEENPVFIPLDAVGKEF